MCKFLCVMCHPCAVCIPTRVLLYTGGIAIVMVV